MSWEAFLLKLTICKVETKHLFYLVFLKFPKSMKPNRNQIHDLCNLIFTKRAASRLLSLRNVFRATL